MPSHQREGDGLVDCSGLHSLSHAKPILGFLLGCIAFSMPSPRRSYSTQQVCHCPLVALCGPGMEARQAAIG